MPYKKGDIIFCVKLIESKHRKIYNVGDKCTIESDHFISDIEFIMDNFIVDGCSFHTVSHPTYTELSLTLERINEHFITISKHRKRVINDL